MAGGAVKKKTLERAKIAGFTPGQVREMNRAGICILATIPKTKRFHWKVLREWVAKELEVN